MFSWRSRDSRPRSLLPRLALWCFAGTGFGPGETGTDPPAPIIVIEPALPELRQRLEETYRSTIPALEEALGLDVSRRPEIVVCREEGTFIRYAGPVPEWSAGVTQADEGRIVLKALPFDRALREVYAHELCHLVLGSLPAPAYERLPLWFHEGLAQVTAGRLPMEGGIDLYLACWFGTLPYLHDIESEFPRERSQAALAYAESESMVSFLIRRQGMDGVRLLLSRVAGGEGFDEAVLNIWGRPLVELEESWRQELRDDPSHLWSHLNRIFVYVLFMAAVPLLGLGVWREIRRRRRWHRRWQEEEEPPCTLPSGETEVP